MLSRFLPFVVAIVVLVSTRPAIADGALRFKTPATCTTDGGSTVQVQPGRYIPEAQWTDLELRYKENEKKIVALEAETKALREYDPGPGWKIAPIAVLAGIVVGRELF